MMCPKCGGNQLMWHGQPQSDRAITCTSCNQGWSAVAFQQALWEAVESPKPKRYGKTVATIIWLGDKVMLAQRTGTKSYSGYWEATGGSVEPTDMNIQEGAAREVREETGKYVPWWHLDLLDCVSDENTDQCFVFRYATYEINFRDYKNIERKKRTPWQLFTVEEALKLKLMPGLKENLKPPTVIY